MEDIQHFCFFQNRACEYFPCHPDVPEAEFNCLFCYCPLYALGKKCGGNCKYSENGIKDCMHCTFPHWRSNYPLVLARYADIADVIRLCDSHWDQD